MCQSKQVVYQPCEKRSKNFQLKNVSLSLSLSFYFLFFIFFITSKFAEPKISITYYTYDNTPMNLPKKKRKDNTPMIFAVCVNGCSM